MHSNEPSTSSDAKGCDSSQLTTPLVSFTRTSLSVTVPAFDTTIVYSTTSPTSGKPLESLSVQVPVSTVTRAAAEKAALRCQP